MIKDPPPAQGAQVSPGPVPPGRLPASRAHLRGGQTTNLPHPAEAVTRSSPCLWRGRMSRLGHSDPQLSWSHRAGGGEGQPGKQKCGCHWRIMGGRWLVPGKRGVPGPRRQARPPTLFLWGPTLVGNTSLLSKWLGVGSGSTSTHTRAQWPGLAQVLPRILTAYANRSEVVSDDRPCGD